MLPTPAVALVSIDCARRHWSVATIKVRMPIKQKRKAPSFLGQDGHSWTTRGFAGRSLRPGVHSFINRPRWYRTPCFTCFIWSRSGIGNPFNRNCTRSRVPMPRRLQCEYGDCMIMYLSNQAESNGQRRTAGLSLDARFYPLGEIIAEFNRVPRTLCEQNACADYLSSAVGREGSTVPIAAMAAEPKSCRRISQVTSKTKKLNRFTVELCPIILLISATAGPMSRKISRFWNIARRPCSTVSFNLI